MGLGAGRMGISIAREEEIRFRFDQGDITQLAMEEVANSTTSRAVRDGLHELRTPLTIIRMGVENSGGNSATSPQRSRRTWPEEHREAGPPHR